MSEMLRAGIVRIFRESDQQVVGVGFLVDAEKKTILTCAHVINAAIGKADNKDRPPSLIRIDFPFLAVGQQYDARVILFFFKTSNSSDDLAVLEILDSLPSRAKAVRLVISDTYSGNEFGVYGFPRGFQDSGQYVEGKLQERLANNRIQAVGTSNLGFFVEGGFSGSPVFNKQLNAVVGMMMQVSTEYETRVAFISPVDVHAQLIGELPYERVGTSPKEEWAQKLTQSFDPYSRTYSSQFVYLPEISIEAIAAIDSLKSPSTWAYLENDRDLSTGAWMGSKSPKLIETLYSIFAPMVVFYWMREFFDRNFDFLRRKARVQFTLLEALNESYRNDDILATLDPSIDYAPRVPNWRLKRQQQPAKYWWQGLSDTRLTEALDSFFVNDASAKSAKIIRRHEFHALYQKLYNEGSRVEQRALGLAANALFGFTPATRPVYWRLLTLHAKLHAALLKTLDQNLDEPLSIDTAMELLETGQSNSLLHNMIEPFEVFESFEVTLNVTSVYLKAFVAPKLVLRSKKTEEAL